MSHAAVTFPPAPALPPSRLLQLMARLEWLCVLGAVAIVVLAYPMQLRPELLEAMGHWWARDSGFWSTLVRTQLEPQLAFLYSPLMLKGALAGTLLLGFIGLRLSRMCLAERSTRGPAADRQPERWLPVALFFAWVMLSALWSPTPAASREGAWWAGVYGLAFWLLLRRGINAREVRQLVHLLIALGVIAMIYLQALRSPLLLGQWLNNPFTDVRNLMGTLLGHNSAAAAFMLLTSFPALALLLSPGRLWARVGWLLYLSAAWMTILITQSRAIWVLAPLLLGAALFCAGGVLGRRALRWAPTIVLLLVLFGLAAQLFNHPLNPFYVREKPFVQRIRDLSADGLLAESRLRLNVIGAQLVPQAPFIGHGLYAFQYVYPAVQGRYFNAHPDSRLMRTIYRSHMAHNEYLQVLIEQGAIGLGLMLWMMGALAVAGLRRGGGLSGSQRLLHQACGWGALGMALHALVDFPFHIPQLVLPALLCVAAFASRRNGPDSLPVALHPALAAPSGAAGFRPLVFARLLAAMICLGAVPFASLPFSIALRADVSMNRGIGWLESFYTIQRNITSAQRGEALKRVIAELDTARRLQPSNAMASMRLCEALTVFGSLQAQSALNEHTPRAQRPREREQAMATFRLARQALDQAREGFSYHLMTFRAFQLAREQARIDPDPKLFDEQLYWLDQTLALLPHFIDALRFKAELLASDPAVPRERVQAVLAQFFHADPYEFDRAYAEPAYAQFAEGRYREAAAQLSSILPINPLNGRWAVMAAQAHLMLGEREQAHAILRALWVRDPQALVAPGGALLLAALEGEWQGVLVEISNRPAYFIPDAAWFRAIEAEAQRRCGRVDYPTFYPRPYTMTEADWERHLGDARPRALWMVFGDAAAARAAIDARIKLGGAPPEPAFWYTARELARVLNEPALANQAAQALAPVRK